MVPSIAMPVTLLSPAGNAGAGDYHIEELGTLLVSSRLLAYLLRADDVEWATSPLPATCRLFAGCLPVVPLFLSLALSSYCTTIMNSSNPCELFRVSFHCYKAIKASGVHVCMSSASCVFSDPDACVIWGWVAIQFVMMSLNLDNDAAQCTLRSWRICTAIQAHSSSYCQANMPKYNNP
jgi:hypothetical protein